MSKKTRGFITILTGMYSFQDCVHFLAAIRKFYRDPIVVLIDQVPVVFQPLLKAFGNVHLLPAPADSNPVLASRLAKVSLYDLSPFDQTIYLDSDICLLEPIDELFDQLDEYDMMMAKDVQSSIAQARNLVRHGYDILPTLQTLGFPVDETTVQYNSGVLAFRRNDQVRDFFQAYRQYFDVVIKHPDELKLKDQGAFAAAIVTSTLTPNPLNTQILSPSYNFMDKWKRSYGLEDGTPIKVLHATYPYRPQYAKNQTRTPFTRLFDRFAHLFIPTQKENPWRQRKLEQRPS